MIMIMFHDGKFLANAAKMTMTWIFDDYDDDDSDDQDNVVVDDEAGPISLFISMFLNNGKFVS